MLRKKLPQGFQDMKRPCSDLLLCRQAFTGAAYLPPLVKFSKPVHESATSLGYVFQENLKF